jgi:hypothetical protein
MKKFGGATCHDASSEALKAACIGSRPHVILRRLFVRAVAWGAFGGDFRSALGAATPAAETIDFNRDIRPILSENCIRCHGPDAR